MAVQPGLASAETALASWLRAAPLALAFGLRLWAAVCVALFVAFWLELEHPSWAGTAALVCQPVLGASLRKGWFRLIGTLIGAIAAGAQRLLSAESSRISARARVLGRRCAFMATLLRNFAALCSSHHDD